MLSHFIQVLYVDDDPDAIDIARIFMKDYQISIHAALSGQEALNTLDSCTYDAIISDYQMHKMDGITLLKEIRKRNINTPFILFTGRGKEEVVIQAIENGVDYYVQKGGEFVAQFTDLTHKVRLAVEHQNTKIVKKT